MMRTVNEIRARIEAQFPLSYAMSWDNPGLQVGSGKREVTRVMLALDATDEVIDEAVRVGAELLLTHHPMIFKSVAKVNDESAVGRRILKLVQHDISYYAMHTNFDVGPGGMADLVAERMGVVVQGPMEITAQDGETPIGLGFVGLLADGPLGAEALALRIKQQFSIPSVVYYDGGREIRKIAVCPGSGRGLYELARKAGADAYVTGDMGHHDGIDAVEDGVTLIDAGHFGLEHIYVEAMHAFLGREFPELQVFENLTDLRKTV